MSRYKSTQSRVFDLTADTRHLALNSSSSPIGSLLVHGVNDDGKTEPLVLVALTPPNLATGDPALLQFVIRRAQANKAPYILTWTLRDAVLWRTPKQGAPTDANNLEKLRDYEDNYDIAPGDAPHMFHETRRRQLLQKGRLLLDDLKRLHKDQALELVNVDATWFVGRLIDSVHDLLPLVTDSLHHRLGMEDALRAKIEKWAVTQGIAGSAADRDFVESITRQIIYRLLGKILFYQSLRRAARQLPPLNVDGLDSSEVLPGGYPEATLKLSSLLIARRLSPKAVRGAYPRLP